MRNARKNTEFDSVSLHAQESKREGELHNIVDHSVSHASYDATGRRVSISDAVFGEITEEGPNYRDVCYPAYTTYKFIILYLQLTTGRMVGYSCPHDEDTNWPWCTVHPRGVRYPWYGTRGHLHALHCCHNYMVELHRWYIQNQSS
jgi:hypothetical protein